MSDTLWSAIIEIIPSVLWVLFAFVALLVLRRPVIDQLKNLRSAHTMFGQFDFEVVQSVVGRAAAVPNENKPTSSEQKAIVSRLEHAAEFLTGRRILWVDDHPDGNAYVAAIFDSVHMLVTNAVSTSEAIRKIRSEKKFDVIITDLARGDDPTAGYDLVHQMRDLRIDTPVILFTSNFDPTRGVDPDLFAYATAFDDLVHFVIDAVERLRFGAALEPTPIASPKPRRR